MAMQTWIDMVAACGIDVRPLSEADVYMLSQKIISDEDLRKRCMPLLENGVLRKGTRSRVIREMSAADRIALRDRVLGVRMIGTKMA